MIRYNTDNEKDKQTVSNSAIAGGLSGSLTRFLLHPLDVLKTRFQLQVEPISHKYEASKYQSIFQAMRTIYAEEKVFAFWKGHVSAQILSVVYGTAQFAFFASISRTAEYLNIEYKNNTILHFVGGGAASSVATLISFPFDVIRTRFIAQGNIKEYETITEAMQKMYKREGYKVFFKGLTPTMIQSIPYGGCQFGFYMIFTKLNSKIYIFSEKKSDSEIAVGNLIAGLMAGLCAKTVVYPFDICRKRLQIQGFQDARKNFGKAFFTSGMINCWVRLYKEESIFAFFKGLQPAMIKSGFSTAVYFAIYDKLSMLLTI